MPLIKRPGRPTLHYRIDDFTDPWQNSPAVLLQHGYGRSSKFCASWVPHLARSYRVVRPDLRGHGSRRSISIPSRQHAGRLRGRCPHGARRARDSFRPLLRRVFRRDHRHGPGCGAPATRAHAQRGVARIRARRHRTLSAAGFPHGSKPCARWVCRNGRRQYTARPASYRGEPTRHCAIGYCRRNRKSDVEVLCGLYGLLRHASAQEFLTRINSPVLGLYPTSGAITSSEQEELLAAESRISR